MKMRILEVYETGELFKLDLQTNLRTYVDGDTWQKIKPGHALPWLYNDMLQTFHKYTRLSGAKQVRRYELLPR